MTCFYNKKILITGTGFTQFNKTKSYYETAIYIAIFCNIFPNKIGANYQFCCCAGMMTWLTLDDWNEQHKNIRTICIKNYLSDENAANVCLSSATHFPIHYFAFSQMQLTLRRPAGVRRIWSRHGRLVELHHSSHAAHSTHASHTAHSSHAAAVLLLLGQFADHGLSCRQQGCNT